jgi:protein-tyrosine phosphatase
MTDNLDFHDISKITDYLYISARPKREHVQQIQALGIRLILSMHWFRPSKSLGKPPVKLLWLPTFDNPFFVMPMHTLHRGVEAALPVIQEGGKVLVHCRAGRHRSVVMACCILIGMGYSADHAIQLVKDQRQEADPDIWYIRSRILKFDDYWREINKGR